MNIAFFDFDGTVTRGDSMLRFIKYSFGSGRYYLGLLALSHVLLGYKLKIVSNSKAKEKLLAHFYKGFSKETMTELGKKYTEEVLSFDIKESALDRIKQHQDKGDRVLLVSASAEEWLRPWAEKVNIELVCTRLKYENDIFTGFFETKNCHGAEKVFRIKELVNLEDYDEIYAYGDSGGDKQMLEIANHNYYREFD